MDKLPCLIRKRSSKYIQSATNYNYKLIKSVQLFDVQDEKLKPDWEAIESIFRAKNVAFNPLKILVCCGLPRIGKSTFCSFIQHINCVNSDQSEQEKLYKLFDTSNVDFDPKTYGVWVTPEPNIVRKKSGKFLFNSFVVDVEGILGSVSDKFIYQQLFVMSALMSTHFIYFLRHPFDLQDYEILKSYLHLAKSVNSKFQKLIILVTNILNENNFKFGLKDSDKYIKELNKEISGKQKIQIDLREFEDYFDSVECFLMPEPGDKIRKRELNDEDIKYNIEDIGDKYLTYCEQFRNLFVINDGITKQSHDGQTMTGEMFANYLSVLHEVVVNEENLQQIPSSLRLLADKINGAKIKEILDNYQAYMSQALENYVLGMIGYVELNNEHDKYLEQYMFEFSTNPWSDSNGTCDQNFKKILRTRLNEDFKQFCRLSNKFNISYVHYLDQITDYLKSTNSMSDSAIREIIKSKHFEIVDEVIEVFKQNTNQNYTVFGFNFETILKESIQRFFEPIEQNIIHFKNSVIKYEMELKDAFDKRNWFKRCFNTSNEYIKCDNDIYPKIKEEFVINISQQLKEKDINFVQNLFEETEKSFQSYYENSRQRETLIGGMIAGTSVASEGLAIVGVSIATTVAISGTVVVIASIATGGLGLIGLGGLTYLAVREIVKPNKIRNKIHRQVQ